MLACHRLWLTTRQFPLIPVGPWFPVLPAPWDRFFFALLLLCLLLAFRLYRAGVALYLFGATFLVLSDQNRLQPWFYMYIVLLLLTLFPQPTALAGCRLALAAVYFWSGIQKLNPAFFREVVPWFAAPAERWLSADLLTPLRWMLAMAGPLEIFIGIGVWITKWRRLAIAAALLVHGGILLFLGPLGRDFNRVVWPWNIAMPLLLLSLFPSRLRLRNPLADLRRSRPALTVVVLFCLLPVLSFFGAWDSSLSFRVYSGNTARADLEVSPDLRDNLPLSLRRFVVSTTANSLVFDPLAWSLAENGVPPLLEPRGFRAMARYLARFAPGPRDIRLVMAPRPGRLVVYEQEDLLRK